MRLGALLLMGLLTQAARAAPADTTIARQARTLLERAVRPNGPGVAVLVARGDRVLYRAAHGLASAELGVALAPAQVFRLGSITKTFTAAAVLQLAAVGQLRLEDPLNRFLPAYPGGAAITLRQLLSHTAGISDGWEASPTDEFTTAQLVALIARQPLDFAPGTAYRYSNSGYILLGAVLEAATRQPWPRALRERLLAPLGLTHTGYYPTAQVVPGRVAGYSQDSTGATTCAPYAGGSGPGAAGALSSTVDDVRAFLWALTHGQLLPPPLYQAMSTPQATADGQPTAYGYGLMFGTVRGVPVVEHNGGIEGFATHFTYFPQQDVTVIVLANTDAGAPNPRSLAHRLGALAIGQPYAELREEPLPPARLASLAGTYRVGPDSYRTVFVRDQRLYTRRDQGAPRRLKVAAGDVLCFENDETDLFRVVRDRRGRVVALDYWADGLSATRREQRRP